MQRTATFFLAAASALNRRTDAAQTGVSRLGKIFSTSVFPEKSVELRSASSLSVKTHSGALVPTAGKAPQVWIVFPCKVISAILVLLCYP